MSLGERLRDARVAKKLTAKELSELTGLPEKTIYRVETGEVQDPKLSTLKPIITALKCSASIIFDDEEYMEADNVTQSFMKIDSLSEAEQKTIAEVVRRWTMIGYIERYFPNEFLAQMMSSDGERNEEGVAREREINDSF